MTLKIYPGIAARLEFFVVDADGDPVPSLTHSDVSAAAYCNRQDGVRSSATTVSLTSSVAATASVSAGQFVTINSTRGHYAIDVPSGAAAAAAADYAEASVTFTAGHNVYVIRHEIDLNLQYATSNVATLSALSGRIPSALVSGRMDCSVGAMASNVITAAALATDAGAEIASAVASELSADITIIKDRGGWSLSLLCGAVADPQAAASSYAITLNGVVYTSALAGQTSAGVRTAPTLSKA